MLSDFGDWHKFGITVRDAYTRLQHVRHRRASVLSRMAGPSLPKGDDRGPDIDNVIAESVDSLYQQLAPQSVRYVCESKTRDAEILALVKGQVVNNTLDEIDFVATLRGAVMEALTGPFAIVKTGLPSLQDLPPHVERPDDQNNADFYAAIIDLDDYVVDLSGTRPGLAMFEGHRYRTSRDRFMALPGAMPDVVQGLSVVSGNYGGSMTPPAESRTTPEDLSIWNTLAYVDVWEIAVYEPDTTWIVTLGDSGGGLRLIRDPFRHYGRARSPYHKVSFFPQPKSVIPRWYGGKLVDLHDFSKTTTKKLRDKIDRLKSVNTFEGASQDVADAIKDADDEEWINVSRADGVSRWSGSADLAEMLPSIEFVSGLVSKASAAAPTLGTRKDFSKTATGDSIRANALSVQAGQMRWALDRLALDVCKDIAWYAQNDPRVRGDLVVAVPGGESVTLQNTPEIRAGSDQIANESVQVFTADPISPPERVSQFFAALGQLMPLAGLPQPMFGKIARTVAVRINEPLLGDLDPTQMLPMAQQAVASRAPGRMQGGPPSIGQPAEPTPPPSSRPQPAQPQPQPARGEPNAPVRPAV